METIKEEIKRSLAKIIKNQGFEADPIIELPKDLDHGDFTTSVALKLGENPINKAQIIKKEFEQEMIDGIDRIEVLGPGFINFYLSKESLSTQLKSLINNEKKVDKTGQTVTVEYTDPNPFKEMHIGHLYSNVVGESLAIMLENQGNDVKRLCYQGDVGLHVAKALWGMEKLKTQMPKDDALEAEKASFLGKAYALGAKAYEEDENIKEEINQINKKVYEKDALVLDLYQKGREWSLSYLETIYKRLGTHFDKYYFESEAGPKGVEIVKSHIKDGIFEESDGAVIFDGEKYGLHKRVFINSQGLPTYEAKELGLAQTKYDDFSYDLSIIVTGNEVNDYFKVLLKVLSLIKPDLAKKTKHVGHGMVRLPDGKISSRIGNVPTAEGLLEEAKKRLTTKFPDMEEDVLEKVAVAAVKYALLKVGIGKDVIFDFDKSISLEGDSGPYLQYTFVRTQSVLVKADDKNYDFSVSDVSKDEMDLLRILVRFDEVAKSATSIFTPNLIATYLINLASQFNLFYQKYPIISREKNMFRLALTEGTGQVIKNGLRLLGIEAPLKM